MLDVLRRGASTWVSKLLLILLAISFGVWGVSGALNQAGPDTVAQVGSTKISARDFDVAWRREMDQLMRRTNGAITRQQAVMFGLPNQVTARMITDAAIEQEARQLGLGVSAAEVDRLIAGDPSLRVPGGGFDPAYARRLLEQNGWTSNSYFEYVKRAALRQQLIGAAAASLPAPSTLVEFAERYTGEERTISYAVIDDAAAGTIEAPSDDVLTKFYDANKSGFRTQETRTVDVALFRPEDIAKPDAVSDADARAYFASHPSFSGAPEERRVQQMPFDDEAAAAAAAAEIAAGKSFDDVAAARGMKPADLDLGLMAKSAYVEPAVADAAFALAGPGAVSGVVKTRFKPVIVRLVEVKAGKTVTFEDVAAQVRAQVARDRAADTINTKRDEIEDVRAGGTKLAEITKQFGMTPPRNYVIDSNGLGPDGKAVDLPEIQKIARAAFAGEVGTEIEPVTLPGGALAYVELTHVEPSRDRKLEEVRDAVVERWRQEETRTRVLKVANEIAAKVRAGTALAEAAAPVGASVAAAGPFKRDGIVDPLSTTAVTAVFGGPEGLVGTSTTTAGKRLVFQVTDVTTPPFLPDASDTKALADSLGSDISATALDQMVRELRNVYSVTINQALINQIVGAGQ
jgi:peptidyl-prolyl cis-trans isomerase D